MLTKRRIYTVESAPAVIGAVFMQRLIFWHSVHFVRQSGAKRGIFLNFSSSNKKRCLLFIAIMAPHINSRTHKKVSRSCCWVNGVFFNFLKRTLKTSRSSSRHLNKVLKRRFVKIHIFSLTNTIQYAYFLLN